MTIKSAPANQKDVTLNAAQIYSWAQTFPEGERVTAVAVALAESGGGIAKVSPPNTNGTRDYGVWQINSVHSDLFDQYPDWWTVTNAQMARAVWDSQGWEAWSVYRSKAYVPFIPIATAASMGTAAETIGDEEGENTGATQEADWYRSTMDALGQIGNAMASIATAVFKAAVWMGDPHNWVRAALVGLGGALVVGALVLVAKPNKSLLTATLEVPKQAAKAVT